jgi:hypothetical protein
MTESWAVYKKIKETLKKIGKDSSEVVVFDICSGKGYSSTLISLKLPKLQLFMVGMKSPMHSFFR